MCIVITLEECHIQENCKTWKNIFKCLALEDHESKDKRICGNEFKNKSPAETLPKKKKRKKKNNIGNDLKLISI